MTASRSYTLHCDDCRKCTFTADSDSLSETRWKAAGYSWVFVPIRPGGPAGLRDICGECAAAKWPAVQP
jgi:hypothetical protein